MKDYNVSKNPYPICKECGQPIIFSVRVPPIKRASSHSYELYRIFCIVDAVQGVCRKCHTKHLPLLDRLRYEEVMFNETLPTSGEGG